jgi:arginase
LIWLDSHGDYNTWETTPSGFLGGMPLAMMVGRGDQRLLEGVGLSPIPETDVILSDARDLDPGERLLVEDSTLLHVADVASLLSLELPNRPLYVHFDIDVLSLDDAPAVSYPAQGGPTYADMQRLMHRLAATGRVVAVSMTTWNFTMDTDRKTEQACLPLFYTLLGEQ